MRMYELTGKVIEINGKAYEQLRKGSKSLADFSSSEFLIGYGKGKALDSAITAGRDRVYYDALDTDNSIGSTTTLATIGADEVVVTEMSDSYALCFDFDAREMSRFIIHDSEWNIYGEYDNKENADAALAEILDTKKGHRLAVSSDFEFVDYNDIKLFDSYQ